MKKKERINIHFSKPDMSKLSTVAKCLLKTLNFLKYLNISSRFGVMFSTSIVCVFLYSFLYLADCSSSIFKYFSNAFKNSSKKTTRCSRTLSIYGSFLMNLLAFELVIRLRNMFCGFRVSNNKFSRSYHELSSNFLSISSIWLKLKCTFDDTNRRISLSPLQ